MCDQVYAWLLRLYPSKFQESYRDEALQLFRDRARDERGFLSRLRLSIDLLRDLAVSVPRSYRTVAAAVAPAYDGTPLFLTLEDESLHLSSLLYGVIASVMIYAVVLILASHAGASLPIRYSGAPQRASYSEAAAGSSSSAAAAEVPDKTGLKGRYDATYQIELLPPPPPPTDGASSPPPSPDSDFFRSQISTIVEDQLGLKLKPGTGPVESLVIDHIEQPSEN